MPSPTRLHIVECGTSVWSIWWAIHGGGPYDNRLAANRHSNTVPDVTTVTVMLNRLPTAVESIGKKRSLTGRGLGLRPAFSDRFFTAMIENPLEKGQTALQPDPDASLPG
jgi:hypothetical protein